MTRTLGYHLVKSAYGQWLPGDDRGSWSEAWDRMIGFIEPHKLHLGDPVRRRMAEERMKYPPVLLNTAMLEAVTDAIAECIETSESGLAIAAAAIESTHFHLLIPYSGRDIEKTTKWIADRTTKAVHGKTTHQTTVWCKGKWCAFVFEQDCWDNTMEYIEKHNLRRERGRKPYSFIM